MALIIKITVFRHRLICLFPTLWKKGVLWSMEYIISDDRRSCTFPYQVKKMKGHKKLTAHRSLRKGWFKCLDKDLTLKSQCSDICKSPCQAACLFLNLWGELNSIMPHTRPGISRPVIYDSQNVVRSYLVDNLLDILNTGFIKQDFYLRNGNKNII